MKIDINIDGATPKKRIDILTEVYVLDFGDNYHRLESEPTSEFERRVRKIKRRYRRLNEFNIALIDYKEWIDYLASIHGGHELLKKKIKYGLVQEYLPHKPKLKNSKTLKYFYENNIVVGETGKYIIDDDVFDEYIENYSVDPSEIDVNTVKKDKDADSIMKKHMESITYKKSTSKKSDIDFLDEYFRLKNKTNNKKKNKKKKKGKDDSYKISLADLYYGTYLDKIEDTTDDDSVIMFNGKFMSSGTADELNLYHKLNDLGWNSYKLMKKSNYGKSVTKIFKKKDKDKKKKKGKSKNNDKLLVDIMTDNGYDDFKDFAKDMENFTSSHIFNK